MAVPRDSIAVLYIIREWYGDLTMYNLIKQTKTGVSPSLLQCVPTKVLDNLSYTCPLIKIANCPASSSSLPQFGKYISYGLGPKQLRRTQAQCLVYDLCY